MKPIRNITEIHKRIQDMKQMKKPVSVSYECPACRDLEFVIREDTAVECECRERKKQARIAKELEEKRVSLIPSEFAGANFDNFERNNEIQERMWKAAYSYVTEFSGIRADRLHSFGMVAQIGESELMRKPWRERVRLREYGAYGVGKTHLAVSIAKVLLDQGYHVMIVNDASFLDEMAQKRTQDGNEFQRVMSHVKTVDVLVWDDIGKGKTSDFTVRTLYQIVDERNRMRRPMIYTSNESLETLEERLQPATVSRLLGMTKELLKVRGEDYRMR